MQEVSMLCSRLGTVPRASLALLAWAGLGIHSVSTAAGSEPAPAVRAADALLPVSGVDVRADLELGEVVVGIRTPFGVTPVRPAVFVAQRFNWETQRPDVRAPRALYDLDFSTTIDADPEAAEAVDAAVLLNQGSARLAPGPDAFVFLRHANVRGVQVAPLIRTAEGQLVKGQPVDLDDAGALAGVSVKGHDLHAFAVDLNVWVKQGHVAPDADIMGLVISHDGAPGAGALALAEIVGGDAPLFSVGPGAGGTGGGATPALAFGGVGGAAGSGGGGGGGNDDDSNTEEEVPAPGAGLILGLGLAAAASRRRR